MTKPLTGAQIEEYEERAAILEFDGKMEREQAEKEAMRMTLAKYGKPEAAKCRLKPAKVA